MWEDWLLISPYVVTPKKSGCPDAKVTGCVDLGVPLADILYRISHSDFTLLIATVYCSPLILQYNPRITLLEAGVSHHISV